MIPKKRYETSKQSTPYMKRPQNFQFISNWTNPLRTDLISRHTFLKPPRGSSANTIVNARGHRLRSLRSRPLKFKVDRCHLSRSADAQTTDERAQLTRFALRTTHPSGLWALSWLMLKAWRCWGGWGASWSGAGTRRRQRSKIGCWVMDGFLSMGCFVLY